MQAGRPVRRLPAAALAWGRASGGPDLVIGGLGTVPGALVGGLVLGIIESGATHLFGPQDAITVGFLVMIVLLMMRPSGILGRVGYE